MASYCRNARPHVPTLILNLFLIPVYLRMARNAAAKRTFKRYRGELKSTQDVRESAAVHNMRAQGWGLGRVKDY